MVDSFDNNHIPDQVRFAWGKELGLKVYRLHCTMFETWALTWPVCSASKGATKLIGWWTLSINCISFNFKASYVKGNFHSLVDFQEKWMLGASAVCCLHMHRSLAWRGLFMNFGSWSPMQNKSSCVLTLKGMEKTIQVEGGLLHTSVFPHLEQLAGTGRSVRLWYLVNEK